MGCLILLISTHPPTHTVTGVPLRMPPEARDSAQPTQKPSNQSLTHTLTQTTISSVVCVCLWSCPCLGQLCNFTRPCPTGRTRKPELRCDARDSLGPALQHGCLSLNPIFSFSLFQSLTLAKVLLFYGCINQYIQVHQPVFHLITPT